MTFIPVKILCVGYLTGLEARPDLSALFPVPVRESNHERPKRQLSSTSIILSQHHFHALKRCDQPQP